MKVGAHIKKRQHRACFPHPLPLSKLSQESSREDTMRRQHLHLKEAALSRHQSWWRPDLRLPASRAVRNPFPFRPPRLWCLMRAGDLSETGTCRAASITGPHYAVVAVLTLPLDAAGSKKLWFRFIYETLKSNFRVHSPNALKCVIYYFYEFLSYLKTIKPGYLIQRQKS